MHVLIQFQQEFPAKASALIGNLARGQSFSSTDHGHPATTTSIARFIAIESEETAEPISDAVLERLKKGRLKLLR